MDVVDLDKATLEGNADGSLVSRKLDGLDLMSLFESVQVVSGGFLSLHNWLLNGI